MKLDQAQYRELESFSKFGSDLDAVTKAILDKGAKNVELLKQGQYSPMPVEKQIAMIYLGTHGLLAGVPMDQIVAFEKRYLEVLEMKHQADVLDVLKSGKITDEIMQILEQEAIALVQVEYGN